jgi:hypothetical protein
MWKKRLLSGKQVRERSGFFVGMHVTVSKLEDSIDTLANPNSGSGSLESLLRSQ